jgi:hypothetical protein
MVDGHFYKMWKPGNMGNCLPPSHRCFRWDSTVGFSNGNLRRPKATYPTS